jgi:hypothetical protein
MLDSPLWRRVGAILLAAAGVWTLDALVFRTWVYGSVLEPDSSTGTFELILRREQFAQARYGPNLILTMGDSRFAYYPREANWLQAETGFSFRHAGVAGTDARAWCYMVRDLDPTRRRYRAVVIGVDDYDDEDGAYDIGDDLATMHYVALRLRMTDVVPFALSFNAPVRKWEAFRGSVLKGVILQRDVLALLTHPAKRMAAVELNARGFEEWTYDYVDTKRNVAGLAIDWRSFAATIPPGNAELKDQMERFVLKRPEPQTGKRAAFRRQWFGQMLDYYRGTGTKVVFVRLPRGPIPHPDGMVKKLTCTIRDFGARPGVVLVNEHAFESLERPELFKDAFHLNDTGDSLLSAMLAREVSRVMRHAF